MHRQCCRTLPKMNKEAALLQRLISMTFVIVVVDHAVLHGRMSLEYTASKCFQPTVKKFYWAWKIFIFCESLHKYLNENLKIQVISGFSYIVMSFTTYQNFMLSPRNLQEVTPIILKQILCLFHTKFSTFINVHKVAMKISWPLCAFCWTHHQIAWLFHYLIPIWCSYLYL